MTKNAELQSLAGKGNKTHQKCEHSMAGRFFVPWAGYGPAAHQTEDRRFPVDDVARAARPSRPPLPPCGSGGPGGLSRPSSVPERGPKRTRPDGESKLCISGPAASALTDEEGEHAESRPPPRGK